MKCATVMLLFPRSVSKMALKAAIMKCATLMLLFPSSISKMALKAATKFFLQKLA